MEFSDAEIEEFINGSFAHKLCDATAWFEHARALIASARISKESANRLINRTEKHELPWRQRVGVHGKGTSLFIGEFEVRIKRIRCFVC